MTEQQIEVLEKIVREHFPEGLVVGTTMPNGAFHAASIDKPKDGVPNPLLESIVDIMCSYVAGFDDEESGEEWKLV